MSELRTEKTLSMRTLLFIQAMVILIAFLGLGLVKYIDALYIDINIVQTLFKAITYIGDTLIFIIIVAITYIVYDKRYAKNLTFILLTNVYLNNLFKDFFQDPRPATNATGEVTPENPAGLIETGYGFPSGHSQGAATFWGYNAYEFKDRPRKYLMPTIFSFLILLVALSRIIIGVHDLQDITGGLVIGIGILLSFIYLEPYATEFINKQTMLMKILVGVILSIILFIIGIIFFPTSGEQLLPNPVPLSDTGGYAQVSGVVLGISIGYILENEYVNYDPHKLDNKYKIINLIIGLVIVLVIYFGLEMLKDVFNSVFYRYIRYAVIALVLTLIVPFIFTKINPTSQ